MGDQNLPQQKQVGHVQERSSTSGVSVRLRPAVTATGLVLLVGGGISFVFAGLGLFSTIAIALGIAVLVTNSLLRRSNDPGLHPKNWRVFPKVCMTG